MDAHDRHAKTGVMITTKQCGQHHNKCIVGPSRTTCLNGRIGRYGNKTRK